MFQFDLEFVIIWTNAQCLIVILTEFEIGQMILRGQLCEDRGEVDTRRTPRGEEGDYPSNVRISLEFVVQTVGTKVDNVLGALVCRLRQQHALKVKNMFV